MSTVVCPSCGHACREDAKHCTQCGTRLVEVRALDFVGRRLQERTAGRYRILRRLGSGGMASVYEATDPLDRPWAIKVLSQALLGERDVVARFEREARTVSRLRHPHIVELHNFEPHEDLHILILEFVPGHSLGNLLRKERRVSTERALDWFAQLADALDYAHDQGVVHRDIKPDNILIRETGEAVITDFGIAKITGGSKGLTQTGLPIGTGYYMSPEQWKGDDIGGAADQYSLGIVLFEALSGERPFRGDTITALMSAHLNQPPPDLEGWRQDLPRSLTATVARMLAKEPGERFESVGAAARAAGGPELDEMRVVPGRSTEPPEAQEPAPATERPEERAGTSSPGGAGGADVPPDERERIRLSATDVIGPAPRRTGDTPILSEGPGPRAVPDDVGATGATPDATDSRGASQGGAAPAGTPGAVEAPSGSDDGAHTAAPTGDGPAGSGPGGEPDTGPPWDPGARTDPGTEARAARARRGPHGPGPGRRLAAALGGRVAAALAAGRDLQARLGPRGLGGIALAALAVVLLATALFYPRGPAGGTDVARIGFRAGDSLVIVAGDPAAEVQVAGFDEAGGALSVEVSEWSSDAPDVATVQEAGRDVAHVAGLQPGMARIRATAGGRNASLLVRVRPDAPPRADIAGLRFLDDDTVEIPAGGDARLVRVEGVDRSGNAVPVGTPEWASASPTVAGIEPAGPGAARVSGLAGGVAEILATVGDREARLVVRVTTAPTGPSDPDDDPPRIVAFRFDPPGGLDLEVGERRDVSAAAVDGQGRDVPGGAPTWTVADPGVATARGAGRSATVTGVAPGRTFLRVASGDVHESLPVHVVAEAVAAVSVSPRQLDLIPGETASLTASVRGTRTSRLDRPVGWASRDDGVAEVDAAGGVRAVAPGTTHLVAQTGERSDSVRVTVAPAARPTDASVALRIDDNALRVSASFSLTPPRALTFCVRGEVSIDGSEWVTGERTTATFSADEGRFDQDLPIPLGEMDLPESPMAERPVTPRVTLWPGPCGRPPTGDPAFTLEGGEVCLVQYPLRGWSVEECRE